MSASDREQLVESAKKVADAAENAGASKSASQRGTAAGFQILDQFGINIISVAVVVALVWAVTQLFDVPINLMGVVVLFGLGILLSISTNRVGSFGFGFWVVTLGIGMWAVEAFVPAQIVSFFDPVLAPVKDIPGVTDLFAMPAAQVFFLAVGVVTVYWLLDIRVFTAFYRKSERPEAVKPGTVTRALTRRWESLLEDYFNVAVTLGLLGVAFIAIGLNAGLDFAGEVFQLIGTDPVGVSAVFNTVLGWLALGGVIRELSGVPVLGEAMALLGDVEPGMFLLIGAVVLGLAFAAREAQD